jgi:quinol-cytochrome oxidoreductase complex cytochrome b subunit
MTKPKFYSIMGIIAIMIYVIFTELGSQNIIRPIMGMIATLSFALYYVLELKTNGGKQHNGKQKHKRS